MLDKENIKLGDFMYDQSRDKFGFITKFFTAVDGSAFVAYKEDPNAPYPYVTPISRVVVIPKTEIVDHLRGIPPLQLGEEVKLMFTERVGKVKDFYFNQQGVYIVEVQFGNVSLFMPEEMLERDVERWLMMN